MDSSADSNTSGKPRRQISCIFARLVMIVSWASTLVLAYITVVCPDIRWRLLGMLLSVLVIMPSLVLGFMHVAKVTSAREPREKPLPEVCDIVQIQLNCDDSQTGIYVDQSTGLASKRYLMMFLRREISRSQRANAAISVAVFDIGDYCKIEQRVGVNAATTALADIGARLKSVLREYDLVARYAPGRLVVIMSDTDAQGALQVVKRLHLLAASVRLGSAALSVTVGMSNFPEHGRTPEELINSAHHALNQGKSSATDSIHILGSLRKAS